MFDCDAPLNISKVICDMGRATHQYHLLYSNSCFEVWLLMHLEDVTAAKKAGDLVHRLSKCLEEPFEKNQRSVEKVLQKGSVAGAVSRAKLIEKKHQQEGKNPRDHISEMNPCTSVYELVEELQQAVEAQK